MTTDSVFERDLSVLLEDLYLGPSPDYRDEALAAVRRTRQRPSWSFAGRWLPMADIASRPAIAPRVPWRTVGLALLVIALTLAAAVLIVGSRQTKVPPPFGLATNGVIVYAIDGDIHTLDPATGQTTPIVTGPENDFDPVFSADGTRVAFRREVTIDGSPAEAIIVVAADGSNPVVATSQLDDKVGYLEWAPDSRSLYVEEANGAAIWQLDAVTPAPPRVVATDATLSLRPFRPPDGDAILINRLIDGVPQISLLDLVSERESLVVAGTRGLELGGARWSPSGEQVIYVAQPEADPASRRLFIVSADGTGEPIQVPAGGRNEFDMDPTWSHDGSRIAFTRFEELGPDNWDVRPIVVYTVADGGLTEIGPRSRDIRATAPSSADEIASLGEGLFFEFSPDATTLLAMPSEANGHPALVDLDSGTWEALDVVVMPGIASNLWQRLALLP